MQRHIVDLPLSPPYTSCSLNRKQSLNTDRTFKLKLTYFPSFFSRKRGKIKTKISKLAFIGFPIQESTSPKWCILFKMCNVHWGGWRSPSALAACVYPFSHHSLPSQWIPATAGQLPACLPQPQLTPACGLSPPSPQLPVLSQLWHSQSWSYSRGGHGRKATGHRTTSPSQLRPTQAQTALGALPSRAMETYGLLLATAKVIFTGLRQSYLCQIWEKCWNWR